jgi:prepilin-type N-terminal cleavage/methylation domain-containing protein/prepilin-type processing-associated H-X9-DG protein
MTHTSNHPKPARRRGVRGFTLVELLVVIGIIAVLISILLPALNRARESSNSAKCLSNLKQIATAMLLYANANKGVVVPAGYQSVGGTDYGSLQQWYGILMNDRYLPAPKVTNSALDAMTVSSVLKCPSGIDAVAIAPSTATPQLGLPTSRTDQRGAAATRGNNLDKSKGYLGNPGWADSWYAINAAVNDPSKMWPTRFVPTDMGGGNLDWSLQKLSKIKKSAQMVFVLDGVQWNFAVNPNRINARHDKATKTNVVFYDGHAESIQTTVANFPTDFSLANALALKPNTMNNRLYWRLDQP